jgi:arginase family enzyme
MPYAVILGWDLEDWREAAGLTSPITARAAALVGGSDLDQAEVDAIERSGIARLDAREMTNSDTAARLAAMLQPMAAEAPAWYAHVDLDVAGPEESPGGHTPAPHWPSRANLLQAAKATAAAVPVRVIGLAAYNPNGDPQRRGAQLAIDMALAVVDRCA